jgi:UDP-3-O-[3-hydroxymyristoyl] glucosamine N-acyltransferase
MKTLTTRQIADLTAGQLQGPGDLPIAAMESLAKAAGGQITFVADEKYARDWPASRASAALVPRKLDLQPGDGRALIRVDNVDLAVAQFLEAIAPPPCQPDPGVHPTAVVEPSARLGPGVRIGAHCYVGRNSILGANAVLHPNVTILDDCQVGSGTVLWPGVVIRERCSVGNDCVLHANVAIGADGFGFRAAPNGGGVVKIPQIGNVVIGNQVELGAATCVDRAKFGSTVIGDQCKIDNLVQIAHNCVLGRCVIIAGNTGVAGSVTIGDGVMIGGCAILKDHITVGAGAKIAGAAVVMNDVPAGESWGGYPGKDARIALREYAAIRQLPDLLKDMKKATRKS